MSYMKIAHFLFILIGCSLPLSSFASLEITEIMYDHQGGDSGYEWIEVLNTGNTAIDLGSWYFRENDTNHGMTSQGVTLLGSGDRAVIVQNISNFESEFDDDIFLMRSSFSLSNTGETLAMADQDKNVVNQITYSSEDGASGDGNSLQLYDGKWISALPTAGTINSTEVSNGITETSSVAEQNTTNNNSDEIDDRSELDKEVFETYYEPYVNFPETIVAGSPARFKVGVYKVKEHSRTRKLKGLYYLNFGDGSSMSSSERMDLEHTYESGGMYILSFEYFTSALAKEAKEEPKALYQKRVYVNDHDIQIIGTDDYGNLIILNNIDQDINLGGWAVRYFESEYQFPRYSFIGAGQELNISTATLGFAVNKKTLVNVALFNDQGTFIHHYEPAKEVVKQKTVLSVSKEMNTNQQELGEVTPGETVAFLDEFLQKNPHKDEIDLGKVSYEYSPEAVPVETEGSMNMYLLTTAGGIALLGGVLRRVRQKQKSEEQEDHIQGDIELIDSDM